MQNITTTGTTPGGTIPAITAYPWTNTTDSFNNTYAVEVLVFSATSCSLSIIGGIIIFATFVALPEIRNFTRKLVICLTVADLITASAYLMSVIRYANIHRGTVNIREENIVCKVQSFFTTYSSLVSFFLTSLIAVYIFDTLVNRSDRLGTTKWLVVFNVMSWLIPGCIVVSALATDVLGSDETKTGGTGPWCWISTGAKNQLMWMLITGKGWEIACYLITMSLYALLKIHLIWHHRRAKFHQIHVSLRDEDKNFLYVWFLLYVLRVWGTVRFFLYVTFKPPDTELYMQVLLRMQAIGDPGQAFVNCFLFCILDRTVFEKLKQIVCCRRQNDSERTKLLTPGPFRGEEDDTTAVKHLPDAKQEHHSSGYSSVASTRSEEFQNDAAIASRDNRLAVTC